MGDRLRGTDPLIDQSVDWIERLGEDVGVKSRPSPFPSRDMIVIGNGSVARAESRRVTMVRRNRPPTPTRLSVGAVDGCPSPSVTG